MSEPLISFIGSSIRTQNWERIYNNLSEGNTVPFEIIFAGPYSSEGIYKLPENFKFIKTNVKPAQCLEIAARNAIGEYLCITSDDIIFEKQHLNKVKKWMSRLDLEKVVACFRCAWLWENDYKVGDYVIKPNDEYLIFDSQLEGAPFIGIAPLLKREIWYKLGGIDKRFHSSFCEVDMILRFYEYGFSPFLIPDCIFTEIKNDSIISDLFPKNGLNGRSIVNRLWSKKLKYFEVIDGSDQPELRKKFVFSKKRMAPVESFLDTNILLEDQNLDW